MTVVKTEYKNNLLKTIEIQNQLVGNSKHFDDKTKEAFLNLGHYWIDRIEKESFTLTQLKFITKDMLTYWIESIGIETELFWIELKKTILNLKEKTN